MMTQMLSPLQATLERAQLQFTVDKPLYEVVALDGLHAVQVQLAVRTQGRVQQRHHLRTLLPLVQRLRQLQLRLRVRVRAMTITMKSSQR